MLSSYAFASPMVNFGKISKASNFASSSGSRTRRQLQLQRQATASLTSAERHANVFRESLEVCRNEEKGVKMASIMRDNFEFLGIPAPKRRVVTKPEFEPIRVASGLVPSLAIDVCRKLWKLPEREYQYVGLDLLDYCKSSWVQVPAEVIIDALEFYIGTKPWWDTIDPLATKLVRTAHESHPKEIRALVEQWGNDTTRDNNMWFRRSAILWQLKQKKNTDEQLLFNTILQNADDNEFFIRKAIGWSLREYRKTQRRSVDRFIEENIDVLSPLSVREAWLHKEEKILK